MQRGGDAGADQRIGAGQQQAGGSHEQREQQQTADITALQAAHGRRLTEKERQQGERGKNITPEQIAGFARAIGIDIKGAGWTGAVDGSRDDRAKNALRILAHGKTPYLSFSFRQR